MIKKRGGAPRPLKPMGRAPAGKAYRLEMRKCALALSSHSPTTGDRLPNKLDTMSGMGRNLAAGYKLQRHGLVRFVKKQKGQKAA